MSYELWKAKVNRYIENAIGLSSDDLPDMPYYDWYERGLNYNHAARKAIKNAGGLSTFR